MISLSGKIKKFDFHPGNLSMAVYTYEKPPKKVSGFIGHPVTQAINFKKYIGNSEKYKGKSATNLFCPLLFIEQSYQFNSLTGDLHSSIPLNRWCIFKMYALCFGLKIFWIYWINNVQMSQYFLNYRKLKFNQIL